MNKEDWKNLTPKEQWDVVVAMRGPDCHNSEPIKWLTTAVLRSAMKDTIRVGGTINDDLKVVVVPSNWSNYSLYADQVKEVCKPPSSISGQPLLSMSALFYPGHFFQHVIEAAQILDVDQLYVDKKVWFKAFSSANYVTSIVESLLEGISKQPTLHPDPLIKILSDHLTFLRQQRGY